MTGTSNLRGRRRPRPAGGGDVVVGFGEAGMPSALVVEAPVVVAVLAEQAGRQAGAEEQYRPAAGADHLESRWLPWRA